MRLSQIWSWENQWEQKQNPRKVQSDTRWSPGLMPPTPPIHRSFDVSSPPTEANINKDKLKVFQADERRIQIVVVLLKRLLRSSGSVVSNLKTNCVGWKVTTWADLFKSWLCTDRCNDKPSSGPVEARLHTTHWIHSWLVMKKHKKDKGLTTASDFLLKCTTSSLDGG